MKEKVKAERSLGCDDMGYPPGLLEEAKVAGGSIVEDKPCFSAESRFLFVVSDGKVLSYNTATGELVHTIETKSSIIAVCPDASNHRRITTCDSESNIVLWDFLLGTSLKKRSFAPLTSDGSMVMGLLQPASAAELYLLLRRPGTDETVDLVRPVDDGARAHQVVRGVRRGAVGRWEVAFGCQGRLVAAIVGAEAVLVRNIWHKAKASKPQYNNLRVDRERPFTCLACHPTEPTVAAGDTSGRLLLWRRLLADQAPVRSVLHWHTLPLPSIAFSPEGTHVLSGGEECVLVYWETHEEQAAFLPRLGMPIRHVTVSPDNQLAATSHEDNVIRLVNPQRKVTQLLRGLSWGAGGAPATGLVLEPRTGALLLNGAVGHLQLFSAHDRKELFSLDVVQTNYLTRERTGAPVTCDVTRAAVTSDGGWLATHEERDDGRMTPERRLKFWRFDEARQSYVLNTCVEDPHESTLTALEFQPSADGPPVAPLAVTTGTDGAIKYWNLVDDSDIYGRRSCWSCDAVGSHRRLPASCAAFSADGSQLAVGFASAVTIWAPDRNQLQHTLSSVTLRDDVRQVVFGRGSCCRLLVARADSGLRVWNLRTVTLAARIDVRVSVLVADPRSEHMAAFSSSNKVFVFRPSSTRPVHQAALQGRITSACFVPHKEARPDLPEWQRGSQLYFLTDQQALHTLDRPGSDAAPLPGDVMVSHLTPTPFSALVAEQQRSAVTPSQPRSQSEVTPDLQHVLQILEGPSHTLPPLTRLCSTFLEGILYPKEKEPEEPMDESPAAEDAAAGPAEPAATGRRREPRLEARLDHLLAADMSWLIV